MLTSAPSASRRRTCLAPCLAATPSALACCLRVLARAQSEGAASAPCPGCRAPFTAAALDVPSLRHDCRAIKRRRSWWVAPSERERELRLALDERTAAWSWRRRSLRLLEWPHWLRLWHFAAGMLLSLGVAAAALAYDHPRSSTEKRWCRRSVRRGGYSRQLRSPGSCSPRRRRSSIWR